jgi:hypothetical protein
MITNWSIRVIKFYFSSERHLYRPSENININEDSIRIDKKSIFLRNNDIYFTTRANDF